MNSRIKKWIIRSVVWGLLLGACWGAAVRLFPLQLRELKEQWRARQLGLTGVRSGDGLAGQSWGEGSTCLVLVHGSGDSVATWHRFLGEWQAQEAAELQKGLRILAWDLPGHGQSERPAPTAEGTAQLRPRLMAERLWAATRAAGCTEKSIWMGNSLGGWVSAWVGLLHPESVRGLILLAPAGLQAQRRASVGELEEPTVESLKAFRAKAYARVSGDLPDWVWKAAVERVRASSVRRLRAAIAAEDFLDSSVGKVQVPTIVIWGKQDQIIPLSVSQGFRVLAPESMSSFREIESCGHLPQKECPEPARLAVRDILQFGLF